MGKLKTIISGSLITGSLIMAAAPALAIDEWYRSPREIRRDILSNQDALRRQYDELAAARRQLDWDIEHGASRRRIADDRQRIQDALNDIASLERDIRQDRRELLDLG